jgi:hypothetical protein
MLLFVKNLVFSLLVPGTVAFHVPVLLAGGWRALRSVSWGWQGWGAMAPLVVGSCIYLRC